MMQVEVIKRLKKLGYLKGTSVTWGNYKNFKLSDHEIEAGLALYMRTFAPEYQRVALQIKGEPAEFDGKFGEIVGTLLAEPRCEYPDFHDPDNRLCMGVEDPLKANWPGACRNKLRFGRSFASLPGLTKDETDLAFDAACRIITRAVKDITLTAVPYGQSTQDVEVFANLKALSGSTLAWSYLARNACGITLEQAYNTRTKWSLRLAITVIVHELLHAMGSPHVNDRSATMFPSIHQLSLSRYGWLHTADLRQMEQLGYTKSGLAQPSDDWILGGGSDDPDPDDPDDPKKPPKTPGVKFTGEIVTWKDGEIISRMRGVPSIEVL